MLRSPDHAGNLYRADDVATALNIAADVTDGAAIDTTMLLRAFANEAADEFVLAYDGHFHCHGDGNVLYVRRVAKPGRHKGKNQVNLFIGRFGSMESARRATAVRWHIHMDDGLRSALVRYLRGITAKRKRKAPDVSPDEEVEVIRDERPPLVPVQPRPNEPSSVNPPSAAMTSMHCMLRGRAGKVVVPKGTLFITFKKLRDNLPPPPIDCGNGDEDAGRSLVLQSYGPDQHWIRSGVTAIATHHLSRLQKQAEVSTKWSALFDGERCTFSDRFHRTLSTFGLHNMRGSDEGMEMIIAGVVKGLAHEVGLPISGQALAYGCPSRMTLARNEKRLAAVLIWKHGKISIQNASIKSGKLLNLKQTHVAWMYQQRWTVVLK